MDKLTADDVIAIHSRILAQDGGDTRMLSEAGLHQMVFHVNLSPDVFHQAAFVLFSFCAYPPFREGNMETAICIIKNILNTEGYRIELEKTVLSGLVKGIDSFSLEIEDLEDWIQRHAQKINGI
jgi:prophage maintenance system killer protein